jgi:SAM-dependent methyltransferase
VTGGLTARRLSGFIPLLGQRVARAAHRDGPGGAAPAPAAGPRGLEQVFPSRALPKFIGAIGARPAPVILDLGPVIGSNITFLGEAVSCKIHVEDVFADLDRHLRQEAMEAFPAFLQTRFQLPDESIDGVFCWDLVDYLDPPAAAALAAQLMRMLRPGGVLLGLFATTVRPDCRYTKYVILSDEHLHYRAYPAARGPQRVLENRDIIKLFDRLRVSDSVLLKSAVRELLFRKPTSP